MKGFNYLSFVVFSTLLVSMSLADECTDAVRLRDSFVDATWNQLGDQISSAVSEIKPLLGNISRNAALEHSLGDKMDNALSNFLNSVDENATDRYQTEFQKLMGKYVNANADIVPHLFRLIQLELDVRSTRMRQLTLSMLELHRSLQAQKCPPINVR